MRTQDEPEEPVEFMDCLCVHATEKAILIKFPEIEKPMWIPQSQVHADSEVWKPDDTGTLVLTYWICKQKGLI